METKPLCEYSKSPGVFAVSVEGEGIMLDLRRDRFLALSGVSMAIWDEWQDGMSNAEMSKCLADRYAVTLDGAQRMLQLQLTEWVASQLVVDRQWAPREHSELPMPRPCAQVTRDWAAADTVDSLTPHALSMVIASEARCAIHLKWRHLPATLAAVQRIGVSRRPKQPAFEATLGSTVKAYHRIRRAFAAGRRDCLPRSIALATALRWQGLDAMVLFGVTKYPFAAHAWVQLEDMAVNDPLSTVAPFTVVAAF